MRGAWWRVSIAVVATGALVAAGTVTPAEAPPLEIARRTAEATLAEVRSAAAAREAVVAAQSEAPEPVAEGTVEPDTSSTIEADDVGATVTFSGNGVSSELRVAVGDAPRDAAVSAQAEHPGGGTPVSDPVRITAKDRSGRQRTKFPAKRTHTRGGGTKGPVVSDVVPGVALSLEPDMDRVTADGLDPASLKIYTRETAGEPWTLLPSYYDARSGGVKGESTHLSEFVVVGTKFVPAPGPVVVLDPDNDEGHATTPAPPVTELGYNIRLAQLVRDALVQDCRATVTITREDPAQPFVSRDVRAGIAADANPAATIGIGFNTLEGDAWGGSDPSQGGSQTYSRGGPADDQLSFSLTGNLPAYTGRPAKNLGNNGNFPGTEFDGVPGALTHLEALFMDNDNDRAVIDNGFSHIADGVLTGVGAWLEAQGFDCTDPVTGGWPSPPSAAELARWRALGLQNYLTYGGEPFSFSTGNLVEQEKLFSLPGLGGSTTELTLFYNSQDGRLSRVGAGWSFGLGARAQRFSDGSVMVVRGDGASAVFASDGRGGYRSDPALHQTLSERPDGRLLLTDVSGESWMFDAGDIEGIGELVTHTDANGSTTTLGYGAPDGSAQQFVPLTSITVPGGQVIEVQSDALGRVTGFTRPGGDHWGLSYDGAGDLSTVTLPDGRTHAFTYDDAHQLLTGTDATGTRYLKNEYDAQGRIVKQWDAAGMLRTLDYSAPGRTTYTDTRGRRSTYFYDSGFRITKVQHPDGTTARFAFDGRNNVTSSTDENDKTTTYTYDGSGDILTETSPTGAVTKYTYTSTGRLATRTDAGGPRGTARTWAYEYDTAGRLIATHQPDGTTVSNRYDATGTLAETVQHSGVTTSYEHDAVGNITTVTDPVGAVTRYAYDSAGRITAVTDPVGRTTSYSWDDGDRLTAVTDPAGRTTSYGYEPNDHVAQVTDPTGAVTRYAWDALFHLTQGTNAVGGVTAYTYDSEDALTGQTDALGATTGYTTDARDRVATVTDPGGGLWRRAYDGVGNLTKATSPSGAATAYGYDAGGRLTTLRDPTGAVSRLAYDAVGRVVKAEDADGVITRFAYDVMDRLTRVTDGLGAHTDYGYDPDGNLTTVTDRDGNVTTRSYDPAGRLTSVTTPMGATTSYAYDPAGRLTATTDPLGRVTTTAYTETGLVASTTDPAGNTTSYAFDAAGRRTGVTDPNGHTTSYAFDGDGRETSMTDATGATTSYAYDLAGRQIATTGPNGAVTAYHYDPAGQLTSVTEGYREGGAAGPSTKVTTSYGYDADGNRTTVTDPNGHTTTSTVDAAGRVTREVDPLGNTTRTNYTPAGRTASTVTGTGATTAYRYDKRGDLIRQDAAGAIATFEYDAEQQLIAVMDPGGVTGFVYDADGRTVTQIDQQGGRMKTTYDAAGQTTGVTLPTGQQLGYTYDRAGRATSQTSPWGSLGYAWDAAGNLTQQSRSTGVTTDYRYDADDRVTAIVHATAPAAAGRAAPSRPTSSPAPVPYAKGDAAATNCSSVAGYLGTRAAGGAGVKADAPLCEKSGPYVNARRVPAPANPVPDGGALVYRYGYDADGNVTSASRTITDRAADALATDPSAPSAARPQKAPASVAYRYDALDRLTGSTTSAGGKNTYGYDAAGNRTSWSRAGAKDGNFTQQAAFDDANELIRTTASAAGRGVSAGTTSYDYDASGNRVNQTVGGVTTRYAYNPAGQPTSVDRPGRTTTYGYDGLGRNTTTTDTTTSGSTTSHTTFDGLSPAQTTGEAGTTTSLRDALGNLVEHVTQTGEATWDLLDRLGSTIAGAQGGSITQLSSYDDWGAQRFETTGWSAPEGFTGERSDPTEGLQHYYARAYDPAAGVWTSRDSYRGAVTQPQSLNRYEYVENNPSSYIDILGNRIGDPSAYNHVTPKQAEAIRDIDNQTNQQIAQSVQRAREAAAPARPALKATPKPEPTGPGSQNNEQRRHALEPVADVLNTIGVISSVVATVSDIAGWILMLTGVGAGFTPIAFLIGKIAGAVGAIIGCVTSLWDLAHGSFQVSGIGGCLLSIVAAAINQRLGVVKGMITGLTRREILDNVRAFEKVAAGVGVNMDLAGLLITVAGWVADA